MSSDDAIRSWISPYDAYIKYILYTGLCSSYYVDDSAAEVIKLCSSYSTFVDFSCRPIDLIFKRARDQPERELNGASSRSPNLSLTSLSLE